MSRSLSTSMTWGTLSLLAAGVLGVSTSSASATILYATNGTSLYQIDTTSSAATKYTTMTQNGLYYSKADKSATVSPPNLKGLGIDSSGNLYSVSNATWASFKLVVDGTSYTPNFYTSPNNSGTGSTYEGSAFYYATGSNVYRVVSNGTTQTTTRIGYASAGSAISFTMTETNGRLYFVDKVTVATNSFEYWVYSIDNAATTGAAGSNPSTKFTAAAVSSLSGITDDGTNVYLTTGDSGSILKLNGDGTTSSLFSLDTGWLAGQMTFDDATDHLFITARNNTLTSLFEYTLDGTAIGSYALPGGTTMSGIVVASVPEAASLSLLVLGGSALLMRRRKA